MPPINDLQCRRGPVADGSGACTGASQTVFAKNINRRYLFIQNVSDAAMNVNFGAAATTTNSVKLAPGEHLKFDAGFIPTDEVTLIGTATKVFVAKQG